MLWKALLLTALFVGVIGEKYELDQTQRQRVHQYIEGICEEEGAKDKTSEVEQSIYTFIDCVFSLKDASIAADFDKMSDVPSMIALYRRVCAKVPSIKTCLYNMLDSSSVCMKSEARTELPSTKKFLDDLLEFLCGNDAEKFVAFVNDGAIQCIDDKTTILHDCVEKATKNFKSEEDDSSNNNSSEEVKEVCNALADMKKCFHNTLVTCPKKSTSSFIDEAFELFRKATYCNKFV